jgi:hypothetical protein
MDMDLNIDNYSVSELLVVLDLSDDPTRDEINKKSQDLIDKFTLENKLIFADFFSKARDRVLEYTDTLDELEEEYKILLEDKISDTCDSNRGVFYKTDHNVLKENTCVTDINPQQHNTMTRMITINSEFIENTFSSNYTFDLSDPINDVISIKLYSFHIPYTWYAIDKCYGTNHFKLTIDTVKFGVDDSEAHVMIEPGNYDSKSLSAKIHDILTELSQYGSCSLNEANGKITLQFPNNVNRVTFYDAKTDEKVNSNLGYIMGFRSAEYICPGNTVSNVWSITSESVCNVNNIKYLQLMLDDFNRNRLNSNIINVFDNSENVKPVSNMDYNIERDEICEVTGPTELGDNIAINPRLTQNQIYAINEIENNRNNPQMNKTKNPNFSDLFAFLPTKHNTMKTGDLCVEFGESLKNNKRDYFGPISLSRLHVKLLDDKGNVINLHGNDWSFTIICETIYQGTQKLN